MSPRKQQSRLRRMLSSSKSNAKQQWKEKGIDDRGEPEQTPALETSTVLSAASSDEDSITTSDSSNTTSVHCSENDPYADVRDQLESLSANCKARFVQQDDSNNDSNNNLKQTHQIGHDSEAIPSFAAYTTYLGYAVLIFFGHIRDFLAKIFRKGRYLRVRTDFPSDDTRTYATLLKSWENFYTRRLYHRIQDCFSRPISSSPGAHIHVLERVSNDGNKTMDVLGTLQNLNTVQQQDEYTNGPHFQTTPDDQTNVVRHCLNLGSYNYLGFADDWNVTCKKSVMSSLNTLPVSVASTRAEYGTTTLHKQVEQLLSSFLGKDDAIVLNMGFNTNATTIPALVSNGDLLISDALNHTSIVNGARASGASIRTFNHNDTKHLDKVLREAIVMGRPRTRRPWNKIMVIVEGIYSMEGEYSDLKNIVKVCKKYGAYVYLDEAHSIGAMGPTGRGICEYTDVDTKDIDVMMGTFTKSFGGMGGYIAGSKDVIAFLRKNCAGSSYHNALSPVVCQQIISSFKVIMGLDGTNIGKQKLQSLRDNSNYFRMRLTEMGLHVLGHYDSPIMPVMLYNPTKIAAFSRECLKRGLAVVVVGFPAVPILLSRARFCISAGHTREDLDRALREIDEVADILKLRYARSKFG